MDDLAAYYRGIREHDRLTQGNGPLEFERTRELLARFLPPPPAVILDVGGGTGPYARVLLGQGYAVHLLDAAPSHVGRVRSDPTLAGLASVTLGDARALPYPNGSADGVLLLGPLYHLTDAGDRLRALEEARRCLRPGGVLLAVGITHTASAVDGLLAGLDADGRFRAMRDRTLETGLHRPPDFALGWFTTAYFHRPEDLRHEVQGAGFRNVDLYAVEGLGNVLPDFEACWADEARRARLLGLIRRTEQEPGLFGVSAHVMAVGWA